MKHRFTLSACLVLLFALTVGWVAGVAIATDDSAAATNAGTQQPVHTTVTVPVEVDYLLYLPKDYNEDAEKAWPLVLFLHGAGERGHDLNMVKRHGPPMLAEKNDVPYIVVSPQCPSGQRWQSEVLLALLDQIEKGYRVDPDRVYVTGLSMGGHGTWAITAAQPQRFAAAVPICGGGNPKDAQKLVDLPIWAFHGEADNVVKPEQSTKMVEAIQAAGGTKVKLTTYPDVGHNSWTQTYDNPEVMEWLLSQKRSAPAKAEK